MSYGQLTPEMQLALQPHVAGQRVFDIGAGDWELALVLRELGAERIIAIDRDPFNHKVPFKILPVTATFEDYLRCIGPVTNGVCFISFPPNNTSSTTIMRIVQYAPVVVYLGSNDDGTACGNEVLFKHFTHRPLWVEQLGERKQTLLVFGPPEEKPVDRDLAREELLGLGRRTWAIVSPTPVDDSDPRGIPVEPESEA